MPRYVTTRHGLGWLGAAGLLAAAAGECTAQSSTVTITRGVSDNFGLPTEPTIPSAGLSAGFSNVERKDYDSDLLNRHVLESFVGLPRRMIGATLRFRAAPISTLVDNDAISLRFHLPDGRRVSNAWSAHFGDNGPGAVSLLPLPWSSYGGTNFSLDLAALPTLQGTMSLLDDMNLHGFLDFTAQDDSNIDYLQLEMTIAAEGENCNTSANNACANATTLSFPQSMYGQTYGVGTQRDVDWYKFLPGRTQAVRASVITTDDVSVIVRGPDCAGSASIIRAANIASPSSPFISIPYLPVASPSDPYLIRIQPHTTTSATCPIPIEYMVEVDGVLGVKHEGGTCIADNNDGCDASAPMESIAAGDIYAGKVFSDDPSQAFWDPDYYAFTVNGGELTEWSFNADFGYSVDLLDLSSGCPGTSVAGFPLLGSPDTINFTQWLPAGNYAIRVFPTESGRACDASLGAPANYLLHFIKTSSHPVSPATQMQTVQNGDWNDPATWNTNAVPGILNSVVVNHQVWMASQANPAVLCEAGTIAVGSGGELRAAPPGDISGKNLTITVADLEVASGGMIRAGDANNVHGVGGSVRIHGKLGGFATIENRGTIEAGDSPLGGGEVYISAPYFTVTNDGAGGTGTIQAGAPSGNVSIIAASVLNSGGSISTGTPDATRPIGGTFNIHGTDFARNLNGGVVTSPSLVSASLPMPYRNFFTAHQQVEVDSSSSIICTTSGTREICTSALSIVVAGRVIGDQTCHDPPTVDIRDNARLEGPDILVAGELLRFRNLINPEALNAEDTITLVARPGGLVDLRTLTSGTNWFKAGSSITIKADTILTSPGVSVQSLFDPDPVILPGAVFSEVCITPGGGEISAAAGETIRRLVNIMNCGNDTVLMDVSITDTNQWIPSPFLLTEEPLAVMESLPIEAAIEVPANAQPGDSTTVTINAAVAGTGVARTLTLVIYVAGSTCPADFDGTGFLDTDDFTAFVSAFEAGDPSADFDGTGFVDTDDFTAFVVAFEAGC